MESDVVKEVIQGAETFGDVMVNGDYSYYMEKKWGDRFACIGDASAFLDPIFASGIYLAMKSVQLVGGGVNTWLDDKQISHIEQTYENINGAYQFLEILIGTFYEPGSIRLAEVNQAKGV
jgi:flavin-dependent dehydrogenase